MANQQQKYDTLELHALPMGGYVVHNQRQREGGCFTAPMLAGFSTATEALKWIGANIMRAE